MFETQGFMEIYRRMVLRIADDRDHLSIAQLRTPLNDVRQ